MNSLLARLMCSGRHVVLLVALVALGGCAVPWIVVKQSGPPSALKGATSVIVSFDYSALMVAGMGGDKSEADWVAAKTVEDANYPTTWAELKSKWEAMYLEGIVDASPVTVARGDGAAAPESAAVVTVTLNRFQLGKYIFIGASDSTVEVTHTWSRNGQVVDQIQTRALVTPTLMNPSVFQHMVDLGRDSGKLAGRFLDSALE